MEERHENEQYFFDQSTLEQLEQLSQGFEHICCLCVPTLGKKLHAAGRKCDILDIDQRFEEESNFHYFDIAAPKWTGKQYDLIICDPPFFNVSLRQLLNAIKTLSNYNSQQKLLICYLERRGRTFTEVFKEYQLSSTNFYAGYETVQEIEKNKIVFFGNLKTANAEES